MFLKTPLQNVDVDDTDDDSNIIHVALANAKTLGEVRSYVNAHHTTSFSIPFFPSSPTFLVPSSAITSFFTQPHTGASVLRRAQGVYIYT